MKDVIIAALLIIIAWLYLDNVKKETAIGNCRAQVAEASKQTENATADLRRQLADAKNEAQISKRLIADLRSKLPNSAWLQDRVDQAKGVLEQPAAPVSYGTSRSAPRN